MELTVCPQCGGTAEVEWRVHMDSTNGPVEHVKMICIRRHWFLLPAVDVEEPEVSEASMARGESP